MHRVTAVILTHNEEPNIARVLQSLTWCERVVIVDSGSTDRTRERALSFPLVAWFTRPFDNHAAQWKFALFETGITTELILALDSDMIVPEAFQEELNKNFVPEHGGGVLKFRYCSLGSHLKGSLYPPQVRLLRRCNVSVIQRGHTQEFIAQGSLYIFKTLCIHDDRKPLESWLKAQSNYSELEAQRIASSNHNGMKDALRKLGLMPLIAGALGYLRAGGPLSGSAALNYAYERMTFELMLALRLLRNGSHEHPRS